MREFPDNYWTVPSNTPTRTFCLKSRGLCGFWHQKWIIRSQHWKRLNTFHHIWHVCCYNISGSAAGNLILRAQLSFVIISCHGNYRSVWTIRLKIGSRRERIFFDMCISGWLWAFNLKAQSKDLAGKSKSVNIWTTVVLLLQQLNAPLPTNKTGAGFFTREKDKDK